MLKNNIDPILQQERISICIICEENEKEPIPQCKTCDKSISLLTSEVEQECPLEKW